MQITDETKKVIHGAIGTAEKQTSSEIVAVVTQSSGSYTYPTLMVSFLLSFVLSLLVAYYTTTFNAVGIVVFQAIVTLLFFALLNQKWLLRYVVPKQMLTDQASLKAYETFDVLNLKTIESHQACMLFVSMYEHFVQIVVDDEIAKKIDNHVWQEIIDNFTHEIKTNHTQEGFKQAIEAIGRVLSQHFPASKGGKKSNFSDELIELT